jgi:hypothetical protein
MMQALRSIQAAMERLQTVNTGGGETKSAEP